MAEVTLWQRLMDFADDVRLNVARRPLRVLLLGIGTALAAAIYVASTLIASASATAVVRVFDELAATRVQVDLPIDSRRHSAPDEAVIEQIRRLPDVVDAATVWFADSTPLTSVRRPWLGVDRQVRVFRYWGDTGVIGLEIDGSNPEPAVGTNEILIGAGLRGRLGIDVDDDLELNGRPARVVGVITESPQLTDLLLGVLSVEPEPNSAESEGGRLVVQVRLGTAPAVAEVLPWILVPGAPEVVLARYPPEATHLRNAVVTKVDALAAAIAAAILIANSLGVGAAAIASVMERYRDIGLRRALGASRGGIAAMVAAELAAIALVAVLSGWAVGVIAAWVYDTGRGLPFVYPGAIVALGVGAAFIATVLAAVPAAAKASRVEPVEALRST
ncbi:MAG: FtsX-like permease family protein [Gammaproteobacteria bacterium]|nr:FtsX-like permease family protein [Gammaproteobacteria bacterium]